MNPAAHGIVDCMGFDIVTSLPWTDSELCENNKNLWKPTGKKWGFVLCRNPAEGPPKGNETGGIYGVIGPISDSPIQESSLGIPLSEGADYQTAMAQLVLACGLSIIEKGRLEFGDRVVISGLNPLARGVFAAARMHGTDILCLVPPEEIENPYRDVIKSKDGRLVDFEYSPTFESHVQEFLNSPYLKTVFIETTADPEMAYTMAIRLEKFGKLIFCRQESDGQLSLDIRNAHHLKSAQFIYWSRPESLIDALTMQEYCARALRLLKNRMEHDIF